MQVYQCCEAIRIAYNQIGSGEQGYVPNAIAATIRARVISRPTVVAWMRRTFAVAFVALGAKLALTDR